MRHGKEIVLGFRNYSGKESRNTRLTSGFVDVPVSLFGPGNGSVDCTPVGIILKYVCNRSNNKSGHDNMSFVYLYSSISLLGQITNYW